MTSYIEVLDSLVLKVGKIMADSDLAKLYEMILKILKASQKRLLDAKDEDNDDNEEDQEEEEDENGEVAPYKLEEALQTAIANLFGALFKIYKEQTMSLVNIINAEILPMSLLYNISPTLTKFALLVIGYMIEYLGVNR